MDDDHFFITCCAVFVGLAEGGDDHLGFGGIEFLAESLEELHEIFSIHGRVSRIVAVLISLPPQEAGDFITLATGIVLIEILEPVSYTHLTLPTKRIV